MPDTPTRVKQLAASEWQLDAELPDVDVEPVVEAPVEPVARPTAKVEPEAQSDVPPSPRQILVAMLFAGGAPLTAGKAGSAIRGLTPELYRAILDDLAKTYRRQNRPYQLHTVGEGTVLLVKATFRRVREKLFGGPREARLSQAALDVLSAIAYRQPMSVSEVEALRGADSGAVVRQLVRLGLIAGTRGNTSGEETRYATTTRFLELFDLSTLDDLPRLGELGQEVFSVQ